MSTDFTIWRSPRDGARVQVDSESYVIREGEGEIDTRDEAQEALRFFNDQYIPGWNRMDERERSRYGAVAGGVFCPYPRLHSLVRPAITVAASVRGVEAEIEAPTLRVQTYSFGNIRFELTLTTGGQTVVATSDITREGVSFQAVPNPGEQALPPSRLSINLSSAEGDSQLGLEFSSTTDATAIQGTNGVSNDIVFRLSAIRIGPPGAEHPTGTDGFIILNNTRIDLRDIDATGLIPNLEVRYSPQTHILTITAATVPSPEAVASVPTDITGWFGLTSDDWQRYRQAIEGSSPLLRLPEAAANLQNASLFIPRGMGGVTAYLNPLSPGSDHVQISADLRSEESIDQALAELRRALDIRRLNPNPPPRDHNDGEPLVYSEAQNPNGTIYFLPYRDGEEVQPDPALEDEMTQLVGADRAPTIVSNGRIDMDSLVTILLSNPALSNDRISHVTLSNLIRSYLLTPNGTLRRNGHRGLITVAQLLGESTTVGGLSTLLEAASDGRRVAMGLEFDDRFDTRAEEEDGPDLQYRAVLPMTPTRVEELLTSLPTSQWDPWVSRSSRSEDGGTERVSLLRQEYDLALSRESVGDVLLLHAHLIPPSGEEAPSGEVYSRTIRLVPITEGGETQTLVLMEEHRDRPGSEQLRPYPLLQVENNVTPIDGGSFLSQTSTALSDRDSSIAAESLDRFAFAMSNLRQLDTNPSLSRSRLLASSLYGSDHNIEGTNPFNPYLQLNLSSTDNPVLIINDIATPQEVQRDLRTRLGISQTVSAPWMARRELPESDQSDDVRYIPLRDLWQASLAPTSENPRGLSFEAFLGLTTLLLTPPPEIRGTTDHLTAPTARYWGVLQAVRQGLLLNDPDHPNDPNPNSLIRSEGAQPTNFFEFNSRAFHSVISLNNTASEDTLDSLVSVFVPITDPRLGEAIALAGHHAESFGCFPNHDYIGCFRNNDPSHEGNEEISTRPITLDEMHRELPDLTDEAFRSRRYIRTLLFAGRDIPSAISTPPDITRLPGGVMAAAWQMELLPSIVDRGFHENFGLWIIVPVIDDNLQPLGYYVGRYSITNTIVYQDRGSVAQGLVQNGLPLFIRDLTSEGCRRIGISDGAVPTYNAGTNVTFLNRR